LPFFMPRT